MCGAALTFARVLVAADPSYQRQADTAEQRGVNVESY